MERSKVTIDSYSTPDDIIGEIESGLLTISVQRCRLANCCNTQMEPVVFDHKWAIVSEDLVLKVDKILGF